MKLKELLFEGLKESRDYSSPYDSATILSVIFDIESSVIKDLYDKMSEEERLEWQKSRSPEPISPDGDSVFKKVGVINVYLRGIPPRLWGAVGNKVHEELTKIGVKVTTGKWKTVDKSKAMAGSNVLRFDVSVPEDMTLADLKRAYHFQA